MPSGNKLPRRLSLKRRIETEELFARGKRVQSRLVTIRWLPADEFRYGVFLRGASLSAVRRNRLKRLLREAVRINRRRLKAPVHIAVLFARPTENPEFHVLDTEIKELFDRINAAIST